MFRPAPRNQRRKPSKESSLPQQPQVKNNNIIKARIQQTNNLPADHKQTKRTLKFANHTNLPPRDLMETKENISHSEEDTKITEQDESEYQVSTESISYQSKSNPELQDYKEDIRTYVLMREEKYMIDHGYLRHHRLLSQKMRSYLVRHIFKICIKFSLLRTTLYLAVHYMDLYFSRNYTFRDQFETVAVVAQACLFIAMKYEEIYPPDLGEWVDYRHKAQIIRLEADVLRALDFQLAHYTLEQFLHFSLWQKTPEGSQNFEPSERTLLLMDLCLFDLTMRQFRPSKLATIFNHMGQEVVSESSIDEVDRPMVQNIKWMIERNKDALGWLLDHKYRHFNGQLFD